MQRWVVDNADRIARTIVGETGKAYEDAMLAEVMYGAAAFGFWARRAPRWLGGPRVRSGAPAVLGKRLLVRYEPRGVVGVIGPWNYPLTNSFGDAIPALAAGNAVILKPSEHTPMTSLLLAERPDGVRRARGRLRGRDRRRPDGRGARRRGRHGAVHRLDGERAPRSRVRAAQRLIPASLELGGKDPMIVLADADLERAANAAAYYAMQNAGQTCISVERVYVEDAVHDEFVALRGRARRRAAPGRPARRPRDRRRRRDDDARAARRRRGPRPRRAWPGARRSSPAARATGAFFAPTVLVDVDHSMLAMREETFGPTLPDHARARRRGGDPSRQRLRLRPRRRPSSPRDLARGEAIARRLRVGAVTVNDALVNYQALELPMGGWKGSGLGARHGEGGIRKFCAEQAIVVSRWHLRRDVHMHPYGSGPARGRCAAAHAAAVRARPPLARDASSRTGRLDGAPGRA